MTSGFQRFNLESHRQPNNGLAIAGVGQSQSLSVPRACDALIGGLVVVVMLAAIGLAWPNPHFLLPICFANGIAFTYAAFRLRLTILHPVALSCFTVLYVILCMMWWRLPFASSMTSHTCGIALVGMALAVGFVGEMLSRHQLPSHARCFRLSTGLIVTLSVVLAAWPARAIDAPVVTAAATSFYGACCLLANLRWRESVISSIGIALLASGAIYVMQSAVPAQPALWGFCFSVFAIVVGGTASLLRFAPRHLREIYGSACARSAEGLALVSVVATCWSAAATFTIQPFHLFSLILVAMLFMILAMHDGFRSRARIASWLFLAVAAASSVYWSTNFQISQTPLPASVIVAFGLACGGFGIASLAAWNCPMIAFGAAKCSPTDALDRSRWRVLLVMREAAVASLLIAAVLAWQTFGAGDSALPASTWIIGAAACLLLTWACQSRLPTWVASALLALGVFDALLMRAPTHWSASHEIAFGFLIHASYVYGASRFLRFLTGNHRGNLLARLPLNLAAMRACRKRDLFHPLERSAFVSSALALIVLWPMPRGTDLAFLSCCCWLGLLWWVFASRSRRPNRLVAARALLGFGIWQGMSALINETWWLHPQVRFVALTVWAATIVFSCLVPLPHRRAAEIHATVFSRNTHQILALTVFALCAVGSAEVVSDLCQAVSTSFVSISVIDKIGLALMTTIPALLVCVQLATRAWHQRSQSGLRTAGIATGLFAAASYPILRHDPSLHGFQGLLAAFGIPALQVATVVLSLWALLCWVVHSRFGGAPESKSNNLSWLNPLLCLALFGNVVLLSGAVAEIIVLAPTDKLDWCAQCGTLLGWSALLAWLGVSRFFYRWQGKTPGIIRRVCLAQAALLVGVCCLGQWSVSLAHRGLLLSTPGFAIAWLALGGTDFTAGSFALRHPRLYDCWFIARFCAGLSWLVVAWSLFRSNDWFLSAAALTLSCLPIVVIAARLAHWGWTLAGQVGINISASIAAWHYCSLEHWTTSATIVLLLQINALVPALLSILLSFRGSARLLDAPASLENRRRQFLAVLSLGCLGTCCLLPIVEFCLLASPASAEMLANIGSGFGCTAIAFVFWSGIIGRRDFGPRCGIHLYSFMGCVAGVFLGCLVARFGIEHWIAHRVMIATWLCTALALAVFRAQLSQIPSPTPWRVGQTGADVRTIALDSWISGIALTVILLSLRSVNADTWFPMWQIGVGLIAGALAIYSGSQSSNAINQSLSITSCIGVVCLIWLIRGDRTFLGLAFVHVIGLALGALVLGVARDASGRAAQKAVRTASVRVALLALIFASATFVAHSALWHTFAVPAVAWIAAAVSALAVLQVVLRTENRVAAGSIIGFCVVLLLTVSLGIASGGLWSVFAIVIATYMSVVSVAVRYWMNAIGDQRSFHGLFAMRSRWVVAWWTVSASIALIALAIAFFSSSLTEKLLALLAMVIVLMVSWAETGIFGVQRRATGRNRFPRLFNPQGQNSLELTIRIWAVFCIEFMFVTSLLFVLFGHVAGETSGQIVNRLFLIETAFAVACYYCGMRAIRVCTENQVWQHSCVQASRLFAIATIVTAAVSELLLLALIGFADVKLDLAFGPSVCHLLVLSAFCLTGIFWGLSAEGGALRLSIVVRQLGVYGAVAMFFALVAHSCSTFAPFGVQTWLAMHWPLLVTALASCFAIVGEMLRRKHIAVLGIPMRDAGCLGAMAPVVVVGLYSPGYFPWFVVAGTCITAGVLCFMLMVFKWSLSFGASAVFTLIIAWWQWLLQRDIQPWEHVFAWFCPLASILFMIEWFHRGAKIDSRSIVLRSTISFVCLSVVFECMSVGYNPMLILSAVVLGLICFVYGCIERLAEVRLISAMFLSVQLIVVTLGHGVDNWQSRACGLGGAIAIAVIWIWHTSIPEWGSPPDANRLTKAHRRRYARITFEFPVPQSSDKAS